MAEHAPLATLDDRDQLGRHSRSPSFDPAGGGGQPEGMGGRGWGQGEPAGVTARSRVDDGPSFVSGLRRRPRHVGAK